MKRGLAAPKTITQRTLKNESRQVAYIHKNFSTVRSMIRLPVLFFTIFQRYIASPGGFWEMSQGPLFGQNGGIFIHLNVLK